MKSILLYSTVFISGAVVMTFEMVGSRVVAPFLGTSTYVWTSLIGVVLASLSLGYWLGGRYADSGAGTKFLSKAIMYGAFGIGWVMFTKDILLTSLSYISFGAIFDSFLASIILFAPTSIALGMVTPLVTHMNISSLDSRGSAVGNIYAVSTMGSIVGTFAAGYVLIPFLGTSNILILMICILLILSLFIYPKMKSIVVPIGIFLIVGSFIYTYKVSAFFIADVDTPYSRVLISDSTDESNGEVVRRMRINNESSSAMYVGNNDLVYDYVKYFRLDQHFNKNIEDTLMIGGAGYSYPKDFLKNNQNARMDVVEIDSGVTELAKKYFNLKDNPRLSIIHQDARIYIGETKKKYDVVYSDAFKSASIPFHLTTKESIEDMYRITKDDGVVIVNVIGTLSTNVSKFFSAELNTFESVFPFVYVFPVSGSWDINHVQNIILVATKQEASSFFSVDIEMQEYLNHLWDKKINSKVPILTDDFAPVDYYMRDLL